MTHSKTAFRRLLALFAPSVGSSALALSAMAGGLLLTGGQAKALTCTFSAASINGCNYGLGGPTITAGPNGFYQQWYESNKSGTPHTYNPTDKDIWFISGPSAGTGDIDYDWIDVNGSNTWLIPPDPHSVDIWRVKTTFQPPTSLGPAPASSKLEYVLIIDKGQGGSPHLPYNDAFEDVTLSAVFDSSSGGSGSYVRKEVYEALCTSSSPGGTFDNCTRGSILGTLQVDSTTPSANLPLWPALAPVKLDKLYIIDMAQNNGEFIVSYQNDFRQVPGPLPLLGAGAAFAFSRKLRRRLARPHSV
jgi:hypothetical protein